MASAFCIGLTRKPNQSNGDCSKVVGNKDTGSETIDSLRRVGDLPKPREACLEPAASLSVD